jgi:hypothetical protein
MGVHSNTSACTRRPTAKALRPATTTTKHIHVILNNSPGQHAYQIHSACRSAARVTRVDFPETASLSCSWASFPCLMPKRPPSRLGKVAPNLVSHLYLCHALGWSGSLGSRRPVVDPESLAPAYSLEELTRPPLIAIEPYSHSRHASNYLSHPTATSPRSLLCTQAGTCISPRMLMTMRAYLYERSPVFLRGRFSIPLIQTHPSG